MKVKTMATSGIIAALYVAVYIFSCTIRIHHRPIPDFGDVQSSCRLQ